jgi:hypothetical protein
MGPLALFIATEQYEPQLEDHLDWRLGMQATVGDRIIIRGHSVGDSDRDCEVLEVRGSDGGPPYVVRWESGHEGLFFPGVDAFVQHFEHGNIARTAE